MIALMSLDAEILASLPGRQPGRQVTAVAAELGVDVATAQAVLLAMERVGAVSRRQRRGSQRWCRGIPIAVDVDAVRQPGLW